MQSIAERIAALAEICDEASARGVLRETRDSLRGARNDLRALAAEAANLEKALIAFDTIIFPDDGDRDPADTAHMRAQLVAGLAQMMDEHGWAGTEEENADLIERITRRAK